MKLLRDKQVADKLAVSKGHVWVLARRPDFPKPLRLSPRHTAWVDEDIDAWLITIKQNGDTYDQAT